MFLPDSCCALVQSVGWPQLPLQNLPEYSSWLSAPMLQTLAPNHMQPMLLQHHLGFSAGEPTALSTGGRTSAVAAHALMHCCLECVVGPVRLL